MTPYKVLIVEDEILIADNIKRYLTNKGYDVIGIAISYEEALQLYLNHEPDITLLDIRLNGYKTGIDIAQYIQQQESPKPYLFLTSQVDTKNLEEAKKTFPAGYLSKPIHKESLFASIEIAMHKYQTREAAISTIPIYDGTKNHIIPINNILYLESEHVYVQVHIHNENYIVQRSSLKDLLKQLPQDQFIQTHRSFAINTKRASHWDTEYIYFNDKAIPVSRTRRKEVYALLKQA